ncbi:MAG: proton-conducting transporter membrane subunit [Fusobacteria bacterium]|nr:proton-conducting transporter membrane subunit [Fusobacteriota bacterium]
MIIVLLLPLIFSLLMVIFKNIKLSKLLTLIFALYFFIFALYSLFNTGQQFTPYFEMNALSCYFLLIEAILVLCVTVYQIGYFNDSSKMSIRFNRYLIFYLLFIFSMAGFILTTNFGLMWIFLEASTLSSTFLVDFRSTKGSTIAAWRYVFICTIGVAFAFIGIIMLSKGSAPFGGTLFVSDLIAHAKLINPLYLKLAFAFIILGMGTKMGLAPMHAWLPSAHSEGPSPVSALLSGTLLNVALLGIIQVYRILESANLIIFCQEIFLIFGMLSLLFSASYMLSCTNYKKMLAYSSIENMGIIAIGLSLGPLGYLAIIIHIVGHSCSKGALFLTSGVIEKMYHTKRIEGVKGLVAHSPIVGIVWLLSFLSLIGLPPFPIFFSELLLVIAMIQTGHFIVLGIFLILITLIIYGMGKSVFSMSFGKSTHSITVVKNLRLLMYGQIVLLILMASLAFYLPEPIHQLMSNAVSIL